MTPSLLIGVAICASGAAGVRPASEIDRAVRRLRHPNASVRLAATAELGGARDERGCVALIDALDDEDRPVRAAVVKALGRCGSTTAVVPLIGQLVEHGWDERVVASLTRLDPEWKNRDAAATAFEQIRERLLQARQQSLPTDSEPADAENPDSSPELIGEATDESQAEDTPNSSAVDRELDAMIGRWEADNRATEALRQLDPLRAADFSIERLTWSRQEWGCLASAEQENLRRAPAVRWMGPLLGALPAILTRDCLNEALSLLEERDGEWRDTAAARTAADEFARKLTTGKVEARRLSLHGLAWLRDPRATRPLLDILQMPREGCPDWPDAVADLALLATPEAIRALGQCAADGNSTFRGSCIDAIASVRSEEVIPVLRALLAEPAPSRPQRDLDTETADPPSEARERDREAYAQWQRLQSEAIEGLTVNLGAAAVPDLAEVLQRSQTDESVQRAAVLALAKIEGTTATAALAEFLRANIGSDSDLPSHVITVLGRRGEATLAPVLWNWLERDEGTRWSEIRSHAMESLIALEGDGAITRLLARARRTPSWLADLAIALARSPGTARSGALVELLDRLRPLHSGPPPKPTWQSGHSDRRWELWQQAAISIEAVLDAVAGNPDPALLVQAEALTHDPSPRIRAKAADLLVRARSSSPRPR